MATMRDVAKAAGVSIATVSATLSRAAYVSPELQARVNAAVESLGYERNSMASGLKRGQTSLIGLIVSDVTNPFFTELVDHVQNAARDAGYSVLLGISDHDPAREAELLRLMRSHQAAGTILCPAGGASNALGPLGRMKLVAVDNAAPSLDIDTVGLDNRRAAALAARHLLELGHRRIAVVAGPARQFVSRERLSGFEAALAGEGAPLAADLVLNGEFRLEEAYRAARALLARDSLPTALFVSNNLMLIGVMRALAEAGLSVPGDMSVVSIDDFPWASAFQPALTVVRQPVAAMAGAALTRLLARLSGDDGPPEHARLEPELVIRGSCAAPSLSPAS
jgi:LacI family transcriptional regulator